MATLSELRDDDLAWAVLLRERTRLAEALHDGALQEVVALRHRCGEAIAGDPAALTGLQDGLRRMTNELRALTGALHEPTLSELPPRQAIDRILAAIPRRACLVVDVDVEPGAERYNDQAVRETIRELTMNVAQHAHATMAAVSITVVDGELRLRVVDDGVGFDRAKARSARAAGHIGLGRLERLADRLGGSVDIRAADPAGTSVTVVLPTAALRSRDA